MKPYKRYKDSGVEWLGEIPEHWEIVKVKYCTNRFYSGGTPDTNNTDYWTFKVDEGVAWVSIADMTREPIVTETEKRITDDGLKSKNLDVLPLGTLIYSMYASLGKVAKLGTEASINQAILGIELNSSKIISDYLFHWLNHIKPHVIQLASSNTQANLNASKVHALPAIKPPLEEQQHITAYLDRHTAQIDDLISKKRRMIALLQEERAAVINRAVTKGLDPAVKMKDSGVEWIEEVPEHWKVTKIRRVAHRVETGKTPPTNEPDFFNGDVDWFTPSDFEDKLIIQNSKRKISRHALDKLNLKTYPAETTLLVGIGATLGKVGITAGSAFSNQQINAIHFDGGKMNPYFGTYFLYSFKEKVVSSANSATLPILNQSQTKDFEILCPPVNEQEAIIFILTRKPPKSTPPSAKLKSKLSFCMNTARLLFLRW